MSYNSNNNFVHKSGYVHYASTKWLCFLDTTSKEDAKLATERTTDCVQVQRRYEPSMAAMSTTKL